MRFDRRSILAATGAAVVASPTAAQRAVSVGWYGNAIIIDGLGGINDPYDANNPIFPGDLSDIVDVAKQHRVPEVCMSQAK